MNYEAVREYLEQGYTDKQIAILLESTISEVQVMKAYVYEQETNYIIHEGSFLK